MENKEKCAAKNVPGEKKKAGIGYKIWAVIFVLISVGLIGMIVDLNILKGSLLISICCCIGAVALLFFIILCRKSKGKAGKITALILSLLLSAGYLFGIYYIGSTVDFLSAVTGDKYEISEYYVVVRDDSKYEKIKDIKGEKVLISDDPDAAYSKGRNQLKKEVKVEFTAAGHDTDVCEAVLKDNAVGFLSVQGYEIGKANVEKFKDDSRILYTVRVKTKAEDISKGVDVTKKPFNIYITGIEPEVSIPVI